MDKLNKHIKQNMLHISEFIMLDNETIKNYFDVDCYYTFDTESCNDDKKAWVYAWAIGNTNNDVEIYGEDINDVYCVFEKIAKAHYVEYSSKNKSNQTFKIFVHNLTWDFEFMKYSLFEMGYELSFGTIKFGKKIETLKNGCFNITENNGDVYSAKINLYNNIVLMSKRKNKKGSCNVQTIDIILDFIDSAKIVNKKLSVIATELIDINEMFYKLGDDYDYNAIREHGHILTEKEKMYLYNDVYILKEFIKQFYIPLNTTKATASGIAFESFLNITFKQGNQNANYKVFESIYPDLTPYAKVNTYIRNSYKGGWTQCNRTYLNKTLELNDAVSIDINSSYPSVVKNCMLPYGLPLCFDNYVTNEELYNMGYELKLLTIAYDGFKNNDDDNLIGEFQVGANNVNDYNAYGFDYKSTDYIATNIIGGYEENGVIKDYALVGTKDATNKRRYTLTIWEFELNNMLENMSFYIEDKYFNKNINLWISHDSLKKGFDVISTMCFKGTVGMFGEAVKYYTEQKIEGKKTGNKCKTETAKLMLNSFYGKMGSACTRVDRGLTFDDNGKIKYDGVVNTYKTSRKYYTAFASATTAWARVNLRTTLYKIGHENVIYFDTDSLYTTITKEQVLEKCGDIIHATDLGKWDLEKTYKKFKCIGSKKYIVETIDNEIICKCAGLPSDVRNNITFETFKIGATFNGKLSKKAIKGGYILSEQIFTIKDIVF